LETFSPKNPKESFSLPISSRFQRKEKKEKESDPFPDEDGANLTEIAAARQLLVRDMKILESIAPESGAYLNEVK